MYRLLITLVLAIVSLGAGAQSPRQMADFIKTRQRLCEVTPDSIFPTIRRLEDMRTAARDSVTWAVISEHLAALYADNAWMAQHASVGESLEEWGSGQWREAAERCRDDARAPLRALSSAKAKDWAPLVVLFSTRAKADTIVGSRWFDDDLLHILHHNCPTARVAAFYAATRSPNAAVMAALWLAGTDKDSLLRVAEADARVDAEVRALVFAELVQGTVDPDLRVALAEQCLARYGHLRAANRVRNILDAMRSPMLTVEWPQRVYPGATYRVPVAYRNIDAINATIGGTRHTLAVRQAAAHVTVNDTLMFTAPAKGAYKIRVTPQVSATVDRTDRADTCTMYVSPLRLLMLQANGAGQPDFIVVDALSGAPVPGHRVECYKQTSTHGRYTRERHMVRIAGDPQPPAEYWPMNEVTTVYREHDNTSIHTDRAIYRPGQTVHLSAIRYSQCHWDAHVLGADRLTLEVTDPKRARIYADTLTTDDFGCVSCSFTLSAKARLGNYSVRLGNHRHSFRVEEYRRPTFAIDMADSLRGKTVDVTVRSFNGTPLRGARVTGRAVERSYWWRGGNDRVQTLDTLFTDANGCVAIPVDITDDADQRINRFLEVSIDVLAPSGETRDSRHVYRLSTWRPAPAPTTMPRDTIAWFRCLNDTLFADRPASIEVGSAATGVHLFMTVFRDARAVSRREIEFSDSLFTLQFTDSLLAGHPDCDGLSVALAFMKDERTYSASFLLHRPLPDTRLRWSWQTFRDLVRPGADEVWTGRLLTPDGRPADASAMFTVYDASLDEFAPHSFGLDVWRGHNIFSTTYVNLFHPYSHTGRVGTYKKPLRELFVGYHSLKYAGGTYGGFGRYRTANKMMAGAPMLAAVRGDAVLEECAVTCDAASKEEAADDDEASEAEEPVADTPSAVIRDNFNETAYFVPSLRTDADGRLALRFTLPDAMTTWQLYGIAHTRDMLTANIAATAVARKRLMAMVHAPRFLRSGDSGAATVTVQNLDTAAQAVTVSVQLIDAATDSIVRTHSHSFTLTADTVIAVANLTLTADFIIRATAATADCSDGEQRMVVVADDSQWTARATDLQCSSVGRHVFNVDSLFESTDLERRVTISYTESPVWTAIDVLRHISVPEHDDAISLHTALYATLLTAHMAQANPAVAQHLQWDADSAAAVADALAVRLQALRNSDGGYSWFAGFMSSEWITAEVATTMARLQAMTGVRRDELAGALDYLDYCNRERVALMKRHKADCVPTLALQYLYVRAMANATGHNSATRYLLNLLVRQCANADRTMTREQMALSVVVLERYGCTKEAAALRKAMRRYLVTTPRYGTAFSYLRGSFTSIDRKLLDHVYAIEALAPTDTLLPDMRRHLLQQKRVQAWHNPLVNASAVYALVMGQPDLTAPVAHHDRIIIDNNTELQTPPSKLQTPNSKLQTLTVDKRNASESWGAVYVETRQRLDDIRPHGEDLAVRRYLPDTAAVGQSVETRLVIHADRDYECVHIAVPRAAALEAKDALSRHHWQGGLAYYHEVHDQCDDLFIERLPKGDYVITLPAYAVRTGRYAAGVARIECLYAPEFCGNTANERIEVK